jgi:glycogen operon protein
MIRFPLGMKAPSFAAGVSGPEIDSDSVSPAKTHPVLQLNYSMPYGALLHDHGVQFVLFSRSATAVRLLLYDDVGDLEPSETIELDAETDRWGYVWSRFVPGIGQGQLYHYQVDGPWDPDHGMRFDGRARLIDPYAKALAGTFLKASDGVPRPPKCVVVDDTFNWHGDRHLRRPMSETIIYEMHVKGFTRHASSGVSRPGTYLGIIEKIPYLKSLGVTAVELMPVHEFPILDIWGNKSERSNYWGYDTMAFFSPHRGYAWSKEVGAQVKEFKEMVKALHQAGLEVILDVVFNHTSEGNEHGPTLSFKGLENQVYYMLQDGGKYYRNYSGCGNTVNGNHPIVREMIFHCLRYWVHNYHIDGFRFDLASILSRDRNGNLVPSPPLLESIGEDPLLADTKIIAEAWDAAGAYQVGCFGDLRWAEWNGRYRDDIRRFWKGDRGLRGAFATRLAGSSDLYQYGGRHPYCSINFVTSHDGFTMNDLVSYREKHNLANGENNRDGDNNNHSDNYGVEGPTRRKMIEELRVRQIKNMLGTLLLSQGVPMVVMGDECRRTQKGNNNAYCQDNDISWMNWDFVDKHADVVRYVQALTKFRRENQAIRQEFFLTGAPLAGEKMPDVGWYSNLGTAIDWNSDELSLTCLFSAPRDEETGKTNGRHVLMMVNAMPVGREFVFPPVAKGQVWRLFLDTSAASPSDVFPEYDGPKPPSTGRLTLPHHTMCVYVSNGEES